jgi:DNA-directed RNA polymerase specialized sigma24 family protein
MRRQKRSRRAATASPTAIDASRFPPPWSVEEMDACFVVLDVNGEVLAYVYCEQAAAKLLTRDEARRIAANIAKLPDAYRQITHRPRGIPVVTGFNRSNSAGGSAD